MVLAGLLAGCQMQVADSGEENVGSIESALETCFVPGLNTGNVCDLGGGQLKFQVTLPAGQQYVEVFAKQNGVQNVALNIVASGVVNGNGTTTYSSIRTGYALTDKVEYRFYSYKPSSPGVFTPGPSSSVWNGYIGKVPVTKDAAAISNSVGLGYVPNRNFGSSASVDIGEYQLTSEGFFGYSLSAIPAGATINRAEMVIPTAIAPTASPVVIRLNRTLASWNESTITWNNRPQAANVQYLQTVTVNHAAESRLPITSAVASALASGEVGLMLAPGTEPSIDNVFIDAKEKAGGLPTYLSVHWTK